ncbi:putative ankyrin repeat-containing domain-containing protein [Helianthus annuus]|nr:putative ankyrin repeat-containing domain-containing protein [Helianthus annuus]
MKIANLLIKEDNSWEKTASWTDSGRCMSKLKPDQMITTAAEVKLFHTADTPLLLATIHDSTEIVREILNIYPQAVEHVDKEGHNILHLAIWHRRYEIIDMVEEMEYPLTRLRGRLDSNYNTLLHMVGHKVDDMKEDIKHPAQELKEDQRLYKVVIISKTYTMIIVICSVIFLNQVINSISVLSFQYVKEFITYIFKWIDKDKTFKNI